MPSLKDLFKKKKTEEGAPPSEELTPEDVDGLSDDEFNEYLSGVGEEEPEDGTPQSAEPTAQGEGSDKEEPGSQEDEQPEPFKSFATEDEYNSDVQAQIDEALAGKSDPERERLISRLVELAGDTYTDSEDPLTALADDLEYQLAEGGGMSVEAYRSQKEADSEKKRIEERDGIIKRWNDDAASMKHIDSEFELMQAMQNETFKDALLSGKTVFEAYRAMKDTVAAEPTPEPPLEPEREPIHQNIQSAGSGTGTGSKNPADLNSEDFKNYINKIKNS